MTNQEMTTYIISNGVNGKLDIDERGQEQVQVGTDQDGNPIYETHDFRYTAIVLEREDITVKRAELQAQLDEIVI